MATVSVAMEEPGVNGRNVVSWVASGVVLWSTAFLLVRALFPKRSYDFCNRAVSTMHAVAAVCLACLSVDEWSCPVCPLATASSPRQVPFLFIHTHRRDPARVNGYNHHRRSFSLFGWLARIVAGSFM